MVPCRGNLSIVPALICVPLAERCSYNPCNFVRFQNKKYCNGNCPCQNFRSKNSFKSDVALKHAPDERPVRKADQKSEIAPRERRREEKT